MAFPEITVQVDTQEARTLAAIYAKGGDVILSDQLRKMADEVDRLRVERSRWRALAKRCIPAVGIAVTGVPAANPDHLPGSRYWHEILEEWNASLEE